MIVNSTMDYDTPDLPSLSSCLLLFEISCTLIAATYLRCSFLSNGLHCARCFHFCRLTLSSRTVSGQFDLRPAFCATNVLDLIFV